MKIKIVFTHRNNALSGVISGWIWERSEIRDMAVKFVDRWCEEGAAVGKSWFFGLRVKVTVSGTARS